MVSVPKQPPRSVEDLVAIEDRDRLELIAGSIVQRAAPSWRHSFGAAQIAGITHPFNRRPNDRGPGGWWINVEVHVGYASYDVFCHDAAGWRRERVPSAIQEFPVRVRPDWVCEIVSPNHEKRDVVDKLAVLHAAAVPHYWLLHPEERMLLVHRWSPDGYVRILSAAAGQIVRAQPFDAIELHVADLFADEHDEPPAT